MSSTNLIVGIVVAAAIALCVIVGILRAKKAKHQKAIEEIQIKFMNLQSGSKAINEEYLRESSEYLMYSAPSIKDVEKIRVDLLNILAKYKEAKKLSSDGFYEKAYDAITKK